MKIALQALGALALLWCCASSEAAVLVRHCDVPTSTGCSVTPIWVAPASALNVQVARGATSPFVKLADVLPAERIAACYDPAIAVGSTAKCAVTVPGRSDLWELKSTIYPAADPPSSEVQSITLTWDAIITDTLGQPFDGTTGYVISRQQDVCGTTSTDPMCGKMPWVSEDVGNVQRKVYNLAAGRWCFRVQGKTASGDLGAISVPDDDDCATNTVPRKRLPAPVGNIRATSP